MGGHCLPVDPFYLSRRAREFDMSAEFIELAGKVNQQMPYHCAAKAQRALNQAGLAVKGARVLVRRHGSDSLPAEAGMRR
jgi:UDP-N-acetyl-D-glucosamine dehydrogenase